MKILLVEDEILQRNSIAILLRRLDETLEIAEAEDGVAALEMMEREAFDVVISDIKMPNMDGLTLAVEISERWADIQLVILTGYATFEYARQALRCGVTDYLLKPARYGDLQALLEKLKKREQQSRAAQPPKETNLNISEAMRSACSYIDAHYAETLSLAAISEQFHVNASYFSEQFKRCNGISFVEHLTNVRMKQACRMLCASDAPSITDIAMQVGYNDSRYFGHVFKKQYGVTPSEYKKQRKIPTE